MSNQLAETPWQIDTAGATILANFHVKLGALVWKGYSDASHTCIVTDRNGNPVWEANGDTDLTTQSDYIGAWINGLIVPTLGSGELLIFLE